MRLQHGNPTIAKNHASLGRNFFYEEKEIFSVPNKISAKNNHPFSTVFDRSVKKILRGKRILSFVLKQNRPRKIFSVKDNHPYTPTV